MPQYLNTNQNGQILVMTIDLGDGLSDRLDVYEHDDPKILARNFCNKHNLTNEAVELLQQNIKNNTYAVLAE